MRHVWGASQWAFDQRITLDAQRDAERALAQERDRDVLDDIDRLKLACEALWSLCSERLGITEDDLRARMVQIDRDEDGRVDGRHHGQARPCHACASMVPLDRDTCQFCGAEVPGRDPFD